jgi:hypothetical protein
MMVDGSSSAARMRPRVDVNTSSAPDLSAQTIATERQTARALRRMTEQTNQSTEAQGLTLRVERCAQGEFTGGGGI